MARIKITDLPVLEELSQEELLRLYGEGLFPAGRLRELAAALALGAGLAGSTAAYGTGPARPAGHGAGTHHTTPRTEHHTGKHTPHHTGPGPVHHPGTHPGPAPIHLPGRHVEDHFRGLHRPVQPGHHGDVRHDVRDVRHDARDVRHDVRDVRHDVRDIRQDNRNIHDDRARLQADRRAGDKAAVARDLQKLHHDQADRHHDRQDLRHDLHDLHQDRRDLHQDRRDLREDRRERFLEHHPPGPGVLPVGVPPAPPPVAVVNPYAPVDAGPAGDPYASLGGAVAPAGGGVAPSGGGSSGGTVVYAPVYAPQVQGPGSPAGSGTAGSQPAPTSAAAPAQESRPDLEGPAGFLVDRGRGFGRWHTLHGGVREDLEFRADGRFVRERVDTRTDSKTRTEGRWRIEGDGRDSFNLVLAGADGAGTDVQPVVFEGSDFLTGAGADRARWFRVE